MTEFIPRDTPIIIVGDYTQEKNYWAYQSTKKQYIDRFGFTNIQTYQTNNRRLDHINFFHDFYQLKRTDGTAPVHYRNKIHDVFSMIDFRPGMNHYNTKFIDNLHLMKKISWFNKHTILLEINYDYIKKDIPLSVLEYDLYAFTRVDLTRNLQQDLASIGDDFDVSMSLPNIFKSCIISPKYSRKFMKFMRDNNFFSTLDYFYEMYSIKGPRALHEIGYSIVKTIDVKHNFETMDEIDYENRWITKD